VDKRQRIRAALQGERPDRVPLSLWRHFHCQDRTPEGLAAATLDMARQYDLDLVKLTPCGLYAVEDWAGSAITYPGTEVDAPYLNVPAITNPADWSQLSYLEPTTGALGRELETIRLVTGGLGGETPCLMTIFSPLTLAFKLAGETAILHLHGQASALHAGLEILAQTTIRFARAALEAGTDGFFFATQLASHRWLTPAEYEEFGRPYDSIVLEAIVERSAITVLHLHGQDVFFDLANLYPIDAVSWHDRETFPNLAQARQMTDRAFITGLDRNLFDRGPAAAIQDQVRDALAQTEGRGLILAPSCVLPTTVPAKYLQAVRHALAVSSQPTQTRAAGATAGWTSS
jgi:uroporphyrinogen decarboxylase